MNRPKIGGKNLTRDNREEIFDTMMEKIKPNIIKMANYDVVIGLPFLNDEQEQILGIIQAVDEVLDSWIGRRQLIVCTGNEQSAETLNLIQGLNLKHPHLEFIIPEEISGRGSGIRAILEISRSLEADLLLLTSKMAPSAGTRMDVSWLESLLTPVQGDYDLVLGSLRRYLGVDSIAHMLAAPILETFYGFRVDDPLGGIYAISHELVEELAHEAIFWGDDIRGYGIDFWILSRAVCWKKSICEINMGGEALPHCLDIRNRIFCDTVRTIFEAVKRDGAVWMQDKLVLKVADRLVRSQNRRASIISHPVTELLNNFKIGYQVYKPLLDQYSQGKKLEQLYELGPDEFHIDDELWISLILDFMLAYNFGDGEEKNNVCNALTALYNGRVASYVIEMEHYRRQLESIALAGREESMVNKMESIHQRLAAALWERKAEFIREWLHRSEQSKPPLVPLGYMEYVPGKPIVIPKKIMGKDKRIVETDHIFKDLKKQYQEAFNRFVHEGLGVSMEASNDQMLEAVENYMEELENALDELLPGDLHKQAGMEEFVHALFDLVPREKMFNHK